MNQNDFIMQLFGLGSSPDGQSEFSPPRLPEPPSSMSPGGAMRRSLSAVANSAEAPGIQRGDAGSAPDDGSPNPFALSLPSFLTDLVSRRDKGGPGDMPPMARGSATAFPEDGMAQMPVPTPSQSNPNLVPFFMRPQPGNGSSGGRQIPTSGPPGELLPPMARGMATASPDQETGFLDGLMEKAKGVDWGKLLMAVADGGMQGMAMTPVSPNAPGGWQTMGAAYTSVRKDRERQEAEKRKMEAANAKLQLDQTLAVRKDTRDERGANRADKEADAKIADLADKALARKNPSLDNKDIISVERLVRDHGKSLKEQFKSDKEILEGMKKYRGEVEERLMQRKISAVPQPQSGNVQSPGASGAGPVIGQTYNGYRYNGGPANDKNSYTRVGG